MVPRDARPPSSAFSTSSDSHLLIRILGHAMLPLPPGYDNALAKSLGAACQLAYLQKSNHAAFLAHAAAQGYAIVGEFTANLFGSNELFGFAATSLRPPGLVVAFRGTDGILDILADVDYAQDPLDLSPGLANAGKTHEGFTDVYLSLRTQVLTVLAAQPAAPTFITGHSLGGAVATAAALDVAYNVATLPRPTIYTFAAPRLRRSLVCRALRRQVRRCRHHIKLANRQSERPRPLLTAAGDFRPVRLRDFLLPARPRLASDLLPDRQRRRQPRFGELHREFVTRRAAQHPPLARHLISPEARLHLKQIDLV